MKIDSFDILLCAGNGSLSKKIRWFNKLMGVQGKAREITHVAMIKRFKSGELSVFESTTMNKWALLDGKPKRGVQLNPYVDWINNYNGKVWLRHFMFERKPLVEKLFCRFIHDKIGTDYESGIAGYWELLMCGLQRNRISQLDNIHCSELDYDALRHFALVDKDILANNMPPYEWWYGSLDKHIKHPLGKAVVLK